MSAKIAQALHEVMSKVSYVQKSGKNAFHGYRYAGEADLLEKLRPAMLDAGLLLIPSIKGVSPIDEHGVTTVQMEYTLVHKDGDIWPNVICAAGQGGDKNKNGVGDKGLYKAITGANKYLLFKLFQIETGDDPEGNSTHESTPRQNPHVNRATDFHDEFTTDIPAADVPKMRVKDSRPAYAALKNEMSRIQDPAELRDWAKAKAKEIRSLSGDWPKHFEGDYLDHMKSITTSEAAE
jgi:hypothetical protein